LQLHPNIKSTYSYLLIACCAIVLFVPFLGQVHLFDWDEINFAECAREMMVTGDYLRMQIDFQPFYEKPPLFIWLQVLSMKCFGINEFAARLPNAITGVVTLLSIFHIGKKVVNEQMAWWWVIMYAASWLPHFYFKSGIIDPVFNLFIFLAVYHLYNVNHVRNRWLSLTFSGVLLGLAVLTKGPVAIIVSGLCLVSYLIIHRSMSGYRMRELLWVALVASVVTALWFGTEVVANGPTFIIQFIKYQIGLFSDNIAGHQQPWFYHPIVLLLGCFPASVFVFRYVRQKHQNQPESPAFATWMWILFWVVLILFSIVKTKIVHYSSLCYFPLTFLASLQVYRMVIGQITLPKWIRIMFAILGIVWGLLFSLLPIAGLLKTSIMPLIHDPFAVGNLQADVSWHVYDTIPGIIYLIFIAVIVFYLKRNSKTGMYLLLVLQLLTIQFTMLYITPKIEAYSQRAAIDFYKQKQGQDVYTQVVGFKSYAHLFYSQKKPVTHPKSNDLQWLLEGEIDKPAYFVVKVQHADPYLKNSRLNLVERKNGFVFLQRLPVKRPQTIELENVR
jgi:4-amino-4-deoxy-L-arabinose transferase-like glycosyltransferase